MVTKNSTTITLTGEEQTVQFDRSYPYFWVQNLGDSDVLISMDSGIVEGADGVITVPAGGSCGTMHNYTANADRLYLLGGGKVQVMGTGSAFNPFKIARKGGDTRERYYIYKNGTEMNGHKITIYHRTSSTTESSKKDLNWIYIHNWFTSVTSTDKISCKGYSKIFIACMGDGRSSDVSTRFTYLKLTDEDGATLDGNDYTPNGNIITSLTLAEYFENTSSSTSSFGGIYSIDIPAGVTEFYLKIQNVNLNSYIIAIWLE